MEIKSFGTADSQQSTVKQIQTAVTSKHYTDNSLH